MRIAAAAAALLAVAPALVVAAPPPLAVAAQNGPYATVANEDVTTLTPSVNGCVYTEYYWRSLPVSQLPLQTITLGTTTLTAAQITEIFQRGAGCCDEDQTIDFAYYYISALENIANGAALPSNVAAALAVVNNTFNNFNIFCNPNLVGPDQKNPEAATMIIHLYNFGQYAPAGSCQDEVTPSPLQQPYPARQNFSQHTVNPTCTVSTPTPAPTTVVVTPAPTTTKAPTPAPTTTAAPTTVATPAPTTTRAPTPAPTTVTAAPTTVATPAPTTTQAPTPAPTTVTAAPTTTPVPTIIRGTTPAPSTAATTAATSTPIVVNLPTTPPPTGAFQVPTTVAATPAPTTVATPAPTTAATTQPQSGGYTPPTQCPSGNVCAPVGAISAFNNSVQQYQCYPNGAYVSSTGAAVVPAVPCIPQGNNGTAMQCPVQYDGPRAPLGVQDYVCYVYDPFRAEAPWAGSQAAYAQCYNPDEQTCTSTNFLCPVSAPYACGRACFNPLQYQCVVNQQNFFNSYLQLQKSSLSGTTCPPQPTNGCPTTTPTSQPPTGALIPPTVTPSTVTPAPTTAATPAPTTQIMQTLPPATPAPTTAATTAPATQAYVPPTTTSVPIVVLPTPAPTTTVTPAPTTTAAPTPAPTTVVVTPAPTTTQAPTPAPTTTAAPTTVATPAPTTTQAPTPAPTTVTPAPTTTIIVTPAPTTTKAPTPAPTTTAVPTTVAPTTTAAPTTVPATTKPATTVAATTVPATTLPATTTPATGPIVIGTTAPATTAPATATVCPTGYPNPGTTGSLVVENPRGTDSCPAPTHLCTEDRYYYLYANASQFAAQELTLGHITYNITGLQELMRIGDQNGFDQSYNLAYQLIPVLENLARGTQSTPELEQIINNAQAYLDKYPPGSPQAEAGTVGCTQTGFEDNAKGLFLYNCGYLAGSPGGCPGTTCQGAENNPHHGGDYQCIGGSSSLYKHGKMRF